MNHNLARVYLMQAFAMKRKNLQKLEQRVRDGLCVIEGCESGCKSRGLCDKHRQRFYLELRRHETKEAKLQFEQNCIQQGLILASGEQEQWTTDSPFATARVS